MSPSLPAVPTRVALAAAALLATALAACADHGGNPVGPSSQTPSTSTAVTAQITQDVAQNAGDATATLNETFASSEVVTGSADAAPLASGPAFSLAASSSTTCSGPDASGFYTCDRTQENGLSVVRMWRFWSGGQIAATFSAAATDSVNHRWTLTGTKVDVDTVNGATVTRTVKASRADTSNMQIVRGSTVQHVWNGTGVRNDTATVQDKDGTRSFVVSATDTVSGVTYAMPRRSNPWPLSGTVTHAISTVWTGDNGSTVTTTRRAVVTFNGTQTATVQVGALTCSLDLKSHQATNCK